MHKLSTLDIAHCALFVALITIGAYIHIPFPGTTFTLQSVFIFLSGLLLGSKKAAIAVAAYVIIGLLGFPIFSGGGGGIATVLKPTFGYLVGFILAAYTIGWISEQYPRPSIKTSLLASLIGMIIIYVLGVPYVYIILTFHLGKTVDFHSLIMVYALLLIPKDIMSCIIASVINVRYHDSLLPKR